MSAANWKRLAEAEVKSATKKQLQESVKELLLGKSMMEIQQMRDSDYSELNAFTWAALQSIIASGKEQDFGGVKELLDFAFGK